MRACLALLLIVLSAESRAALLVNNGAAVEADLGLRYNYAQYTIYDQFVLAERSVLTSVEWSQFDEVLQYTGSTISFFSGLPTSDTLIGSFEVVASRLANGLDVVTDKAGNVAGFDYLADVRLVLAAGEYLIGVHNHVTWRTDLDGELSRDAAVDTRVLPDHR